MFYIIACAQLGLRSVRVHIRVVCNLGDTKRDLARRVVPSENDTTRLAHREVLTI